MCRLSIIATFQLGKYPTKFTYKFATYRHRHLQGFMWWKTVEFSRYKLQIDASSVLTSGAFSSNPVARQASGHAHTVRAWIRF